MSLHDEKRGTGDPESGESQESTGELHQLKKVDPPETSLSEPLEGVAAALKMQVDVLHRIHEQQEQLGAALKDNQRSEMMIQSTRSLNESFSGMRRTQESLLERLEEDKGRGRGLFWITLLGIAGLIAVVVWSAMQLNERTAKMADSLTNREDSAIAVQTMSDITEMKERLSMMEGRDHELMVRQLSRLQGQVASLEEARKVLEAERDRAREDLGEMRARVDQAHKDRDGAREAEADLKQRLEGWDERLRKANQEIARLNSARLKDQERMTALLELQKSMVGKTPATDVGERVVGASEATELPTKNLTTETDGSGAAQNAAPKTEPQNGRVPVTLPMIQKLNGLLAHHQSSEKYVLISATSMDPSALYGAVLEVQGADGSVAKTVHADVMRYTLASGPGYLELDFEGGFVEYRHGLTRTVRSPFFNNRYQIVVLGVNVQDWLAARLGFLKTR